MYNNWFEALVIILSVMLALLLLLSIIFIVKLIQISSQIKRITDHAEQVVDKAEQIAGFFEKTATPIAILKIIANVSESVQKAANKVHKKKGNKWVKKSVI